MRTDEYPEILAYQGDDIIVSDGTSVLDTDNKAAITAIMVAIEEMQKENLPHGDVHVCFVLDEKIGLKGAKTLDLTRFPVDFAYTIDCCEIGEVVYKRLMRRQRRLRLMAFLRILCWLKGYWLILLNCC
ncbi:hypothetical protein [Suttonella ornithocola]|uniref:Peptidase T n=1 Tax=Suttonella ornithocola TaxID=279832 RepID=A0A380N0M6_9GAMM|nr:hypothetical protein [Suttonella ornithocola]SUO97471.1 Peptidase T [Suttonella ornithocola]